MVSEEKWRVLLDREGEDWCWDVVKVFGEGCVWEWVGE